MGKKSAPRRARETEAMAIAKNMRISPRKLGLVAGLIRGKSCENALAELAFSRRRISNDVRKVLQSAIANAENNHQLDVDKLYVAEVSVGRAFALGRFRPRARGRVAGVTKFYSHLTLVVREREDVAQENA